VFQPVLYLDENPVLAEKTHLEEMLRVELMNQAILYHDDYLALNQEHHHLHFQRKIIMKPSHSDSFL
jgi:hypothetical protein